MRGREGLAMANRRDEDERFEVILTDLGSRKITVIKLVREILGLGLSEAMHFVENLPQAVARDVSIEADARVRLESIGSP
jgi:large subunit ribosomal protein L7/L12